MLIKMLVRLFWLLHCLVLIGVASYAATIAFDLQFEGSAQLHSLAWHDHLVSSIFPIFCFIGAHQLIRKKENAYFYYLIGLGVYSIHSLGKYIWHLFYGFSDLNYLFDVSKNILWLSAALIFIYFVNKQQIRKSV